MKLYSISSGCYSDYINIIITNKKDYTDEEFLLLCKSICEDLKRKDDYLRNLYAVLKILINKHEFTLVNYPEVHLWDYSFPTDFELRQNPTEYDIEELESES